jgi:hypothetical protein
MITRYPVACAEKQYRISQLRRRDGCTNSTLHAGRPQLDYTAGCEEFCAARTAAANSASLAAVFAIIPFTCSASTFHTSITLCGSESKPLNSSGRTSRSKSNSEESSRAASTASENFAGCAVERTIWTTSGGLQKGASKKEFCKSRNDTLHLFRQFSGSKQCYRCVRIGDIRGIR